MTPAVSLLGAPPPAALPFEMVERKGLGHPDTICDALAEALSVALSRAYLERAGTILHHNVDKALLSAGVARPAFGGGRVEEPFAIHLSGRATAAVGELGLPLDEIAVETSRAWLRANLRALDPDRDARIVPHLRPTSPELAALFRRGREADVPLANDTSFGVGFAPLDLLERVVLAVERALTAPATRDAHPALGEDVKVMGVRRGAAIEITLACAMIGRHLRDLAAYREAKATAAALARAAALGAGADPEAVAVRVNAADGDGDAVYLTVTGLSAEAGDDGQVGRGNRVNGLITPYRPMSLEAVAGKNPVSHVGKLYNVVATRAAHAVTALPGVREACCWLVSRIGQPVDAPQAFDVKVRLDDPGLLAELTPAIAAAAEAELRGAREVWRDAVAGRLAVW